jgi:hypothetical protein
MSKPTDPQGQIVHHLPTGHLDVRMRVLSAIKQPHFRHLVPLKCSQVLQTDSRRVISSASVLGIPAAIHVPTESANILTLLQDEQLIEFLMQAPIIPQSLCCINLRKTNILLPLMR